MQKFYKIFRAVVLVLIALAIFIPAATYVVLSTDWASERLQDLAETELTKALGTKALIGDVKIDPFNILTAKDIVVDDDYGREALKVKNLSARFEFWHFIFSRHFVFDYVVLDGAEVSLYRKTADSPLNIAGIIEKLKGEEDKKEPSVFDLSLYAVRLNSATFKYDVLDAPAITQEKFDARHVHLSDIDVYASLPRVSNQGVTAKLRHLSFTASPGFYLKDLTAEVQFDEGDIAVDNVVVDFENSHLDFGSYRFEVTKDFDFKKYLAANSLPLEIAKGSFVNLKDLSAFVPGFRNLNRRFNIELTGDLSENKADIKNLKLSEVTDGGTLLGAHLTLLNPFDRQSLQLKDLEIQATVWPMSVIDLISRLGKPADIKLRDILRKFERTDIKIKANGDMAEADFTLEGKSSVGSMTSTGNVVFGNNFKDIDISTDIDFDDVNAGQFINNPGLRNLSGNLHADVALIGGKLAQGDVKAESLTAVYRDMPVGFETAEIRMEVNGDMTARMDVEIGKATILSTFVGNLKDDEKWANGNISVSHLNLYKLGVIPRYENYEIDGDIDFNIRSDLKLNVKGNLGVTNFNFRSSDVNAPFVAFKELTLNADNSARGQVVTVSGDFINGSVEGEINYATLPAEITDMLSSLLPALIPAKEESEASEMVVLRPNDFRFSLDIDNVDNILEFFKVPFAVAYPISIEGSLNDTEKQLILGVDAPYIMQGDKLIEQTSVDVKIDGMEKDGRLFLSSRFPTKKGDMVVAGGIKIADNTVSSKVNWEIERDIPIKGSINLDTRLFKEPDFGKLCADVSVLPSDLQFGSDLWHIDRSEIGYRPGSLTVDKFKLFTDSQTLFINGSCVADKPESEILISLDKLVLNTIFENLDINKALIGGTATGTLHAGGLFSGTPFITSDNLHVDNIGYNYCVLGDGDIKVNWNNDKKAFSLDAVISQEDNRKSYIKGDIFPTTESLDIEFIADKVKVGFMKPFMEAFAQDLSGHASGRARIYGTFKYIDMEGDIFADNLGLKIGFTNTWYYATDSIRVRSGLIDINGVKVKDSEGHLADLNGFVKHYFFKDPSFEFRVTNARDFLCYDVTPKLSPDWYGKIYGNGTAYITGSPGVVNIDVNMSTASGSTFTFVLSDMEEAEQYKFLTFRDKNRNVITDSIIQTEILPQAVVEYREKMRQRAAFQNPPSRYNMNFQIDVTPDAKIVIVMDPVGGDEIKSWGKSNLRMTYNSIGNDLRMYGTYVIDRGSYNFTLQDIIVKDFIIREGSSIKFTGDPYNAELDITASYVVNANLSDLDESFLNDPDLNRTNVPVHALLLVHGDMRQPDIDFDLEFPTLTSDVYRKVRSIVNTEEMMNRQMIYLLALNRFYTPEYMNTTKGNELFSVASSTISSRLSSMLGKLSENWSFSPNLRSDRGDFSDVQFDVALSSNLLNNRLRMNGNFGYRDKSLNTTQFIGDFDLEYLLNPKGTWRLKAYNRFNDQTYFLRTAKTTQGIGIKFQRDFDNLFNFLKFRKKAAPAADAEKSRPTNTPGAPVDSTATNKDTIKTTDK